MTDAKPFSDEDLRGFKEGSFHLTEKFGGKLVAEWIRRFLATITVLQTRSRADRKRFEETLDGYTKDWAEQKRGFQKRIEELEIKIKMSGMDKELYGEHLVDPVIAEANRLFSDQLADQTATIKRLRGERKADLELMEHCRDIIGCFIHDEDANVLPETTLLKTEILEFDEMFGRLDEVVEAARKALDAKEE